VLAVLGVTAAYLFAAAPPAAAATINVPGNYPTIQAAVNAANPGDTIIVQPGTYNESVVVNKSIKIHGAPNKPNPVVDATGVAADSGCGDPAGFNELDGFCVFPLGPSPITNVEIDHFTIQNFSGSGIIAVNAVGLNFHDNTAIDNDEYGIARFDSSQTQIVHNDVSGSGEAGIYVGDSPNASALVRLNNAHDNGIGIFLRDSSHGTASENTANDNCFGILLVDSGAPGQTFDWVLVHNTTNTNTAACPAVPFEHPAFSGGGVVVAGANHARVTANTANGNTPGANPTFASGGIAVVNGAAVGGPVPSYVQIDNNSAFLNAPYDLFWDLSGNHITFFSNHCGTSSPSGLCIP
jgi:parallel beta-helix repeat protein